MVHQQQSWVKDFKALAASKGFSQILSGGSPAACLRYPEEPVPEEVVENDPNFYRKNKDREEIIRLNVKNAKLRQQIVLDHQNSTRDARTPSAPSSRPLPSSRPPARCAGYY